LSWLDDIVASTTESESPERYWWFAGLSVLSATIKKNVWIDRFFYKLYPNTYVLLVSAKSGLRKGVPIALAKSLLEITNNTKIIAGRNTIQAVLTELSKQYTLESGAVLNEAQGILLSDEFAMFLQENTEALTILTGLQNTHEHENSWKNTIKGSPVETLKSPCIQLLGASNEALFESVIKSKDIEGGFLARTFIVYESQRRCINSLVDKPENLWPLKDMSQHLKKIQNIKGEFQWSNPAKLLYKDWYHKLATQKFEDKTGSVERLGDQALKVAMLMSLANGSRLVIEEDILEEAIERSETCVLGAVKVSRSSGKSEIAKPQAQVLDILLRSENHSMPRRKLLNKLYPDLNAIILDRVLDTLEQVGALEITRQRGVGVVYTIPEKWAQQYENSLRYNDEESA
jgi:hypothetical protein